MKKRNQEEEKQNSIAYQFATAMDYLQMALQTFFIVPFMLLAALLAGELRTVFDIACNNCCTIAEAAVIWLASYKH